MHCPHCAFDNPLTARFCTRCGQVLVEDASPIEMRRRRLTLPIDVSPAPGKGRKAKRTRLRKLRVPGLRQRARAKAPNTAAAAPAAASTPTPARRRHVEWLLAAAMLVGTVGAYVFYPARPTSAVVVDRPAFVPLPVSAPVLERPPDPGLPVRIAAPLARGRLDVVPPAEPPRAAHPASAHEQARKAAQKPQPSPPVPMSEPAVEAPEPIVQASASPAPKPLPVKDHWQRMEEQLAHCDGWLLERVICDQKVRLAFCDGHWGEPHCPSGRLADYGQ